MAVHPRPRGRGREDRPRHRGHRRATRPASDLPSVAESITIRQRKSISVALIADRLHALPQAHRACFPLFVGQAFLYNAFFFTYGDTLSTFLGVKQTGWYIAAFAVSNFLGALMLGPLFDTIGRVKMIAGTYILSGILLGVAGLVLGSLTAVTLTIVGARHLLLRLGRRERGLPHRQRGLPDGDPGAVHRVLLRDRHGGRRHLRPAAVRHADRQRLGREDITRSPSATTSAPR